MAGAFKTNVVPDTLPFGDVSCPDLGLKNASNDAKDRHIAFQSDFPIDGHAPRSDHPQVFMWTKTGITAVTDWVTQGWSAAVPAISGDGRSVVFAGTGNPAGTNPDGEWQIFSYNVASHAITQVTNGDVPLGHRRLGGRSGGERERQSDRVHLPV